VVTTFAQGDSAGTPIGGATPRPFVAGRVDVDIRSSRARRGVVDVSNAEGAVVIRPDSQGSWSDSASDSRSGVPVAASHKVTSSVGVRSRRQAAGALCADVNYSTPPCAVCTFGRERGDTNGDCVFDIRDVGFVQLYKVEESFGFTRPEGVAINTSMLPAQRTELDADLDGDVTPSDALFLARVNFDLLRFVSSVEIRPIQDALSEGYISINVTTLKKGGNPSTTPDPVAVYLDVAHTDSNLQPDFNTAAFRYGSRLTATKSNGLVGMFVRTQIVGPLYEGGQMNRLPERCWRSQDDVETQCGANSITSSIFYYDDVSRECRARVTTTCFINHFPSAAACAVSCEATYKHRADFQLNATANNIGVSVAVVTFDSLGATGSGRYAFLFSSARPPMYPQALSYDIAVVSPVQGGPSASVPIHAGSGYSPLLVFNNTVGSNAVTNYFPPVFPGNYTLNVSEATAVGQFILSVAAVDPDPAQITPGIDYVVIDPPGACVHSFARSSFFVFIPVR
jgi:protocadherin Fat 4